MKIRILQFVILGSFAFLGGMAGTFLQHSNNQAIAQIDSSDNQNTANPSGSDPLSQRYEQVIRKVSPAVVAIQAIKPSTNSTTGKTKTVEESGSGVIIRWPGISGNLVITNNHVITGASAEQIVIHLADNRLMKPVSVLADPESDIALLQLKANDLPCAEFGDSDRIRVGQWVLAFGSPFGFNQTVTHGIISARERGQVSLGSTIRIKEFLQTDAAINPGSSGGPLVNLQGELVGINTAIATYNETNSGVSFSIPINLIKRITRQLLDKGVVLRGYLGVQLANVMEPADAIKLGLERAEGARIESIYPGTPAARAGLRSNDVILTIDGIHVRNENHLINLISTLPPGQKIKLSIWREKHRELVQAEVGDWVTEKNRLKTGH